MTAGERVIRTLNHQPVDRAPRDLWTTPHTWMFRKDELDRLHRAFEWDFVKVGTGVRPFERIQFLRGTENVLMDLAYGTPEVSKVLREGNTLLECPCGLR